MMSEIKQLVLTFVIVLVAIVLGWVFIGSRFFKIESVVVEKSNIPVIYTEAEWQAIVDYTRAQPQVKYTDEEWKKIVESLKNK